MRVHGRMAAYTDTVRFQAHVCAVAAACLEETQGTLTYSNKDQYDGDWLLGSCFVVPSEVFRT